MLGLVTLLIVPLLICTGLSVILKKRSTEAFFPISTAGMILVLFLAGVCGNLAVGAGIIICIFLAMFLAVIYHVIKDKNTVKKLFTPGLLVMGGMFCLFLWIDYGKLADGWDEFSHWMDIVKVYTYYNRLGSNDTQSLFASYYPGLPLYEYLPQCINAFFGIEFKEWLVYLSYHVFALMAFMPFFSKISSKAGTIILVSVGLFLHHLVFFHSFLGNVYIDPMIGLYSGAVLAYIFLEQDKDLIYDLTVFSYIFILIMLKSAGVLFGLIALLYYMADLWSKRKPFLLKLLGGAVTVAVPILLWNRYVITHDIDKVFGDKISLKQLAKIVFSGEDTYRTEVWNTFWSNYRFATIDLNMSGLKVEYPMILIYGLIVLWILLFLVFKEKRIGQTILLSLALALQTGLYVIGTCVTYMFKFSEGEARHLASFVRYMSVGFQAILTVLTVICLYYCLRKDSIKQTVMLVVVMLVISPLNVTKNAFMRQPVKDAIQNRSGYMAAAATLRELIPDDSRVYFISQNDSGYDYWVFKYEARPMKLNGNFQWSICTNSPGTYDREISCEELEEELKAKYDYIYVFTADNRLTEEYSEIFGAEPIADGTLIKVIKNL